MVNRCTHRQRVVDGQRVITQPKSREEDAKFLIEGSKRVHEKNLFIYLFNEQNTSVASALELVHCRHLLL